MAAETEQPEPVQPRRDRVAAAVSEPVRRWQPERRHPCCGIVVTHGRDPEPPAGRLGHRGQVGLVHAGVADRLPAYEGPVTEQVCQQHHLVVVPRPDLERRRDVAQRRDPRAGGEVAQRRPAVVGEERVVGSRLDLATRRQP